MGRIKTTTWALTLLLALFTLTSCGSDKDDEWTPADAVFYAGFTDAQQYTDSELLLIEYTYKTCIRNEGLSYSDKGEITPNGKSDFEEKILAGCKKAESQLTLMEWDGYYEFLITGRNSQGENQKLYTHAYGTKPSE